MTMICMSNDINFFPQPMVPNQDLFHTVKFKNTTTMFYAFDDEGNYITPEECLTAGDQDSRKTRHRRAARLSMGVHPVNGRDPYLVICRES